MESNKGFFCGSPEKGPFQEENTLPGDVFKDFLFWPRIPVEIIQFDYVVIFFNWADTINLRKGQ